MPFLNTEEEEMRRLFITFIGVNASYLAVLVVLGIVFVIIMRLGYQASINGDVNLVFALLSVTLIVIATLRFSPASKLIEFMIGYGYSLLPGVGSPSAREDIAKIQKIANQLWTYTLIAFTFPLSFMGIIPLKELDTAESEWLLLIAIVCIVIYSVATSSSFKRVWSMYFILGCIGLVLTFMNVFPDTTSVIKDTTKSVSALVSNLFASEPEPVWMTVSEMSYTPDQAGWTKRSVSVPPGFGRCRIICKEGYKQYITTANPYYINVQCGGVSNATANGEREDTRFHFLQQLIKVKGVTYGSSTDNFPCDNSVTALLAPNAKLTDVTNFRGNIGKSVFIIQKEMYPPNS